MVSFNPLYPTSLTLSLPIADTYGGGRVRLAEEEGKKAKGGWGGRRRRGEQDGEREREMKGEEELKRCG